MKRIFKRIKRFYKNESYEEEKTMKIVTTIFVVFLLLITPIVTHYKNVYWEKQYEKAEEQKEMAEKKSSTPSPTVSSSPVPTVLPLTEELDFK